jgi:hypothetical protein
MKTTIISYSFTGNNNALANSLAGRLSAKHVRITEPKHRNNGTIAFDMLLNRIPKTGPKIKIDNDEFVILIAPVWMGNIASPMRGPIKDLKSSIGKYAFVSISGGAMGPNPKLGKELKKRLGADPVAVIDLHIRDLLPQTPKPTREDTSKYKLTQTDVKNLTDKVSRSLEEAMKR